MAPAFPRVEVMEAVNVARERREAEREHDLLSFLSVIVHEYTSFDLDFTLLGIILNDSVLDMRQIGCAGGYF